MDRRDELLARPGMEQAEAHYDDMQTQLRDRLSAELGPFDWQPRDEPGGAGCGSEFPEIGGETRALQPWWFRTNVPDEQWPRAAQIADEVTSQFGFEPLRVFIDAPGDHLLNGNDRFGAFFTFGTESATIMRVTTGCHLPDAARTAATSS